MCVTFRPSGSSALKTDLILSWKSLPGFRNASKSASATGNLHIWKGSINAERHKQVLEQHLFPARRKQKLNHILHLFQQHGFVVEESSCWTDLPAVPATLARGHIWVPRATLDAWAVAGSLGWPGPLGRGGGSAGWRCGPWHMGLLVSHLAHARWTAPSGALAPPPWFPSSFASWLWGPYLGPSSALRWAGAWRSCDGLPGFSLPRPIGLPGPGAFPVFS